MFHQGPLTSFFQSSQLSCHRDEVWDLVKALEKTNHQEWWMKFCTGYSAVCTVVSSKLAEPVFLFKSCVLQSCSFRPQQTCCWHYATAASCGLCFVDYQNIFWCCNQITVHVAGLGLGQGAALRKFAVNCPLLWLMTSSEQLERFLLLYFIIKH